MFTQSHSQSSYGKRIIAGIMLFVFQLNTIVSAANYTQVSDGSWILPNTQKSDGSWILPPKKPTKSSESSGVVTNVPKKASTTTIV
ncbi:hypothetical protein KBD33_01465, partial [Candidatus Gracilibacteria bacterium]|nr:hypothetical protein [Candidatus Gracilibacteria bacterium]